MATDKSKNSIEADSNIDLTTVPLEEPEDGVFAAYSNLANVDWTLHDVRIRFAELIQVPNEESPTWVNQHIVVLERVMVTLPWRQAKNLCHLLTSVIDNYERLNGELKPVKLPPGLPFKKSS
jgi:hypothetical protein